MISISKCLYRPRKQKNAEHWEHVMPFHTAWLSRHRWQSRSWQQLIVQFKSVKTGSYLPETVVEHLPQL